MKPKATLTGSMAKDMERVVRTLSGGLADAVTRTGKWGQAELRAQARAAGFRDGGRSIANAWRMKSFPAATTTTLRPAALVFSKAPDLVRVFDEGATVTAKGRKYLAVPTAINRIPGKRVNRRVRTRVTPAEMFRLGGFIRPTRNPNVRLWCLPLRQETTKRGRLKLFAGPYSQILTGRIKGQQQARRDYAAAHSFVPMFFLLKQVTLRKRLDIAAVERAGQAKLAAEVMAVLARLEAGA